jgi:hypothetical protein
MSSWLLGLLAYVLHTYDEWTTAFNAGWQRSLASFIAETMYWVLPKSIELTENATKATRAEAFNWMPFLTSLPFVVVCLALACWWFSRQDY